MNIYDEIEKITSENTLWSMGVELLWFVKRALKENTITIYEAFLLMEISDRFEHGGIKKYYTFDNAVLSMNLALTAKLFNENDLYEQFCRDARERMDSWFNYVKKSNDGVLPKNCRRIIDDVNGRLSVDLEHLKELSSVR